MNEIPKWPTIDFNIFVVASIPMVSFLFTLKTCVVIAIQYVAIDG